MGIAVDSRDVAGSKSLWQQIWWWWWWQWRRERGWWQRQNCASCL